MVGRFTLTKTGSFNSEAPSFGDLVSVRKKVIATAFCTSYACAGNLARVKIDLVKRQDTCPDCGHYLIFIQKVERR